jgi:predicted nucleic acid-binding protein
MKVLVDTSVWIDHFHRANPHLQILLHGGHVWTHTVVIGELAAGRLLRRDETLLWLQKLPRGDEMDLLEGLHLIDEHKLSDRGLSWADVQLLAAASIDHLTLWARDRALTAAAVELGLAHVAGV